MLTVSLNVITLYFIGGGVHFFVILGAYTRLGDAGLGCPDWPTCYGHLIVPDHVDGTTIAFGLLLNFNAFAEYGVNMTEGVTSVSRDIYGLHMMVFWVSVAIAIVVIKYALFIININLQVHNNLVIY
jgi:hypothetical protein